MADRFMYQGEAVYNRFTLMCDIAAAHPDENSFDIVLETFRTLERLGIIQTLEGPTTFVVVQDWDKGLI